MSTQVSIADRNDTATAANQQTLNKTALTIGLATGQPTDTSADPGLLTNGWSVVSLLKALVKIFAPPVVTSHASAIALSGPGIYPLIRPGTNKRLLVDKLFLRPGVATEIQLRSSGQTDALWDFGKIDQAVLDFTTPLDLGANNLLVDIADSTTLIGGVQWREVGDGVTVPVVPLTSGVFTLIGYGD